MMRHQLLSALAILCVQASFALGPGDRIVVVNNGKEVAGQIVELISGDSKAVIEILDGRTIVALTEDIAYSLPPLIEGSESHTWRSSDGKHTTKAYLVNVKDDTIYLQKQSGIVIAVNSSKLSESDVAYAREQSRALPEIILSAGDPVKISVPQSTPVDRSEILSTLTAGLERSGYVVNDAADTELVVDFRRQEPEESERFSLSGKRDVKFTPTTVQVSLSRSGRVLHEVSYTTKTPYTLPAGAAGEKKLHQAETAVLPFLRTLAIPTRFPDDG